MADPRQDPTVLAYMRALGFEEADAQREVAGRKEQAQQKYAMAKPQVQQEGIAERESIQGGFESRGMLKSGAYATANARQLSGEQFRLGSMQMGLTDEVSSLESQLAAQIAAARRQAAERLLSVGASQYLEEGLLPFQGG